MDDERIIRELYMYYIYCGLSTSEAFDRLSAVLPNRMLTLPILDDLRNIHEAKTVLEPDWGFDRLLEEVLDGRELGNSA